VTLFGWLALVGVWLYRMNEALSLYDPLFIIPLLQVHLMMCIFVVNVILMLDIYRTYLSECAVHLSLSPPPLCVYVCVCLYTLLTMHNNTLYPPPSSHLLAFHLDELHLVCHYQWWYLLQRIFSIQDYQLDWIYIRSDVTIYRYLLAIPKCREHTGLPRRQ